MATFFKIWQISVSVYECVNLRVYMKSDLAIYTVNVEGIP